MSVFFNKFVVQGHHSQQHSMQQQQLMSTNRDHTNQQVGPLCYVRQSDIIIIMMYAEEPNYSYHSFPPLF